MLVCGFDTWCPAAALLVGAVLGLEQSGTTGWVVRRHLSWTGSRGPGTLSGNLPVAHQSMQFALSPAAFNIDRGRTGSQTTLKYKHWTSCEVLRGVSYFNLLPLAYSVLKVYYPSKRVSNELILKLRLSYAPIPGVDSIRQNPRHIEGVKAKMRGTM